MKKRTVAGILALVLAVVLCLSTGPSPAAELESKLVIVTSYPKDMTDDVLEAVRDLPKCVKYLHVPAQHGSDEQLRRMKRGYTVAEYREMHDRAKRWMPDVAITSDFIVGFSGETEEQFQATMRLVEGPSKKAAVANRAAEKANRAAEGKSHAGADASHGFEPIQLTGRTMCDRIVVFDGNPRQIGQTLPVVIYEANAHTLQGVVQA